MACMNDFICIFDEIGLFVPKYSEAMAAAITAINDFKKRQGAFGSFS